MDATTPTEPAVRETELRYRSFLDAIDSGYCIFRMNFDDEGTPVDYLFTETNPAFERQTGLANAVGRTALELVPNLEQHWFDLYGEVARTGEPARFQQGSVAMGRVFDVNAFRLGPEGSSEVALLFTDITAQKTSEETLRKANEQVVGILESITDAFFSLDREWRFTYVNRQAEQLLGRAPGDLLGLTIWEAYPAIVGTAFETVYRGAAQGIAGVVTPYYPEHHRWYEVHAGPAADGITVYFRDASESVRNEEERERLLREVEAERRKLELAHAQSLAFIAILKGPDLIFDYANEPYYQLVGHRDILGKPLAEALPEVVAQGFPEILLQVMASGEPFEAPEMTVLLEKAPGAPLVERLVSLRYLPVLEADGSISGVYSHGLDVTEAVIARRTLAARAEETAIGSRRKDEFLATLAHELRNPLAPIRLSTELLGILDPADPEFEEARTVIGRQVDYMVRLVDDLLDVSRVAQGKIKLQRETVDVARIVRAAIETSLPSIEAGAHSLGTFLPETPLYVHGDATRLAQVLANLLNNSAKYTPRGGQITVSATDDGRSVILSVRDSGVGIPVEMLPVIFDMFAQVEVHLVQSQGGLGIGLTLSRRLVELHGGTIEARSEGAGMGSEFLVRIPLVSPPKNVVSKVQDASIVSLNQKILVVDDNVDGAWTLSELLGTMGHEVRIAHTGAEALTIASEFGPTVVLLDLGLPDMPGYEVARRFRADPVLARAYLVAQTGWGREEDRALGRDAGFDDHLVKPLSRADLNRVLARR